MNSSKSFLFEYCCQLSLMKKKNDFIKYFKIIDIFKSAMTSILLQLQNFNMIFEFKHEKMPMNVPFGEKLYGSGEQFNQCRM